MEPRPAQLGELVQLVRDLRRQNLELAGQVGFLQGQLQAAHDRLKPLEGVKEEPPAELSARAQEAPRRWWQRWGR